MTARETIENLWDRAIPVGPLLDAFTHELAEEIRLTAHANVTDHPLTHLIEAHWNAAADLIDPEVDSEV